MLVQLQRQTPSQIVYVNPDRVAYISPPDASMPEPCSVITFDDKWKMTVMGSPSDVAEQINQQGSKPRL